MSPRRSARLRTRASQPTISTPSRILPHSPASPSTSQPNNIPTSPGPSIQPVSKALDLPVADSSTPPAISLKQPALTRNTRSEQCTDETETSPTASHVETPSAPLHNTCDPQSNPSPANPVRRRPFVTDENVPESRTQNPKVAPPSSVFPTRVPFQSLQTSEPCPSKPVLTTYAKHRRGNVVEIPSSRALGMLREKSPVPELKGRESPNDSAGESDGDGEEDDVQSNEEDRELNAFMMQQKALWAEVDAVDLEEQTD